MDNWIYGMFDGWIGFNIYYIGSFSSLLDESAVILDLTETSLERIIHTILNKVLKNRKKGIKENLPFDPQQVGASSPSSPNNIKRKILTINKVDIIIITTIITK